MGNIDIDGAQRPSRRARDGSKTQMAAHFFKRYPPSAKRHTFLRNAMYDQRDPPINPNQTEIPDPGTVTAELKNMALSMGVDIVGVAAFKGEFAFADAELPDHDRVIVLGKTMPYDIMADIGPKSQSVVHQTYFDLDDIGLRFAQQIGAYGYGARLQPNGGDFPLIPYAYLAGLGELGKHGSLISPELGSSFRLSALSTNMPINADGPVDEGIEEVCASCNVCERFCPGGAIRPDKFTVNGVERWHVDTPSCEPYFYKMYGCKICLMVCPFNTKGNLKEAFKPAAEVIRKAKDAAGLLKLIEERTDMKFEDFDYSLNDDEELAGSIR